MPRQAARRCSRCKKIVRGKCGCTDKARGHSAARGYGHRWRKVRKLFLQCNPMCHDCRIEPAEDVHHIVKFRDDEDLHYDTNNLMALCHECHSVRTRRGE